MTRSRSARRTLRARLGRRARRGFTLVEVIVAVMVFSFGVLSLAAGAALSVRLVGGGARQTIAASVAQRHFEQMRGASCTSLASGADTLRGVVSVWTVTTVTRGRAVKLAITYNTHNGSRTRTYRTIFPC